MFKANLVSREPTRTFVWKIDPRVGGKSVEWAGRRRKALKSQRTALPSEGSAMYPLSSCQTPGRFRTKKCGPQPFDKWRGPPMRSISKSSSEIDGHICPCWCPKHAKIRGGLLQRRRCPIDLSCGVGGTKLTPVFLDDWAAACPHTPCRLHLFSC